MEIDAGYANFLKTQVVLESIKTMCKEDIQEYYPCLYSICSHLNDQNDLELFVKLCAKLYQLGYYKSVNDHKEALQKQGLQARVTF